MTLQPFHSDRLLMSPVAVAGILTLMHAALDFKNSFVPCWDHQAVLLI